MDIVLYMGGCCGDIITGLIDTKGVSITSDARCAVLKERARLKRGFEFENDAERDTYIQASSLHWKSLPSHDTEYHIRKQHDYIGIICKNEKVAYWSAERFRNLHRPVVWERMCKSIGITSTNEYAQNIIHYGNYIGPTAKNTLDIQDIIEGNAIEQLKTLTDIDSCANILYKQWIEDVVDEPMV